MTTNDEQSTARHFMELVGFEKKPEQTMWVQLIPDGEVQCANGNFFLDRDGAKEILATFKGRGIDIVIDYHHESGEGSNRAGPKPAAGWIKQLNYREGDGLYGLVEWTPRALELLKAKEYRYLSPTIYVEKNTRRTFELESVALTHTPAIKGGLPVAASRMRTIKENQAMDGTETTEVTPDQKIGEIKTLLKQKGVALEEGAGRDAILAAVIAFLEGAKETPDGEGGTEDTAVANSVRQELGLKPEAGKEQVVLAMSRLKGETKELTELRKEVGTLQANEATRRAGELVGKYVTTGTLDPNDEKVMANARAWAEKDPVAFDDWHAALKPIVPQGRTTPPQANSTPAASSKDDELITAALKEHEGNHKKAMISLQTRMIDEECERTGMERKRVVNSLTQQHPKIFG